MLLKKWKGVEEWKTGPNRFGEELLYSYSLKGRSRSYSFAFVVVIIIQEINSIWSIQREVIASNTSLVHEDYVAEALWFVVSIFQTKTVQRHTTTTITAKKERTWVRNYIDILCLRTHFIDLLLVMIFAYSSFPLSLHSF